MLGLIALVAASAFASAAIYINVAEHPARMPLPAGAALAHFKPAYKAGFVMQSSLAIVAGVCGLAAFYDQGGWLWPVGAALILANWPFTLIVILPLNKQLMAVDPDTAGEDVKPMLARWARLHAVRSMLGALAALIFLIAVL